MPFEAFHRKPYSFHLFKDLVVLVEADTVGSAVQSVPLLYPWQPPMRGSEAENTCLLCLKSLRDTQGIHPVRRNYSERGQRDLL